MKPHKHGKKWEIIYRCPGYEKPITEAFDTMEEAELRAAQVALDKKFGRLVPPLEKINPDADRVNFKKNVTVAQLMSEFIDVYGKTQWAGNTASSYRSRTNYYILPMIGDVKLMNITGHFLTKYYTELLGTQTIPKRGQQPHKVSACVVQEVHKILRCAFNQAIKWEWMTGPNPADYADVPAYKKKRREVLSEDELKTALRSCEDPVLNLCIHLALGCSMRIGEILGLTWDDIHVEQSLIDSGDAYLHIGKQLQRLKKIDIDTMRLQDADSIQYIFPDIVPNSNTSLVLSKPKTESSNRDNYIPRTIAQMLIEHQARQQEEKEALREEYLDYNLVIAQSNGRPYERKMIHDALRELEDSQGLSTVVFHSFRHSSTSMKLKIGGGDIKSVQGDTGHAQASMVTDVYSHIATADRKRLAVGIDPFFANLKENPQEPEAGQSSTEKILSMLKKDPDKAEKVLKMLELLG